jgi:DNA repair protein RecO
MSYHLYQNEAFVLDERPFSEANKTYYLLTPDLGLVTATAQGVRLLKSKLRFQLDKLAHVRVVLVRGKENWRLIGVEKTNEYNQIYLSKEKLNLATKIFALLRRFIQGESPQKLLFADLKISLDFLADLKLLPTDSEFLASWEQVTVLRLLHFLGYIKDLPKLAPFVSFTQWSEDILRQAKVNKSFLLGIINEAIEVSHI